MIDGEAWTALGTQESGLSGYTVPGGKEEDGNNPPAAAAPHSGQRA